MQRFYNPATNESVASLGTYFIKENLSSITTVEGSFYVRTNLDDTIIKNNQVKVGYHVDLPLESLDGRKMTFVIVSIALDASSETNATNKYVYQAIDMFGYQLYREVYDKLFTRKVLSIDECFNEISTCKNVGGYMLLVNNKITKYTSSFESYGRSNYQLMFNNVLSRFNLTYRIAHFSEYESIKSEYTQYYFSTNESGNYIQYLIVIDDARTSLEEKRSKFAGDIKDGLNLKSIELSDSMSNYITDMIGFGDFIDPDDETKGEYRAVYSLPDVPDELRVKDIITDRRFKSEESLLEFLKEKVEETLIPSVSITTENLKNLGFEDIKKNVGDLIRVSHPVLSIPLELVILSARHAYSSDNTLKDTVFEVGTLSEYKKRRIKNDTIVDNLYDTAEIIDNDMSKYDQDLYNSDSAWLNNDMNYGDFNITDSTDFRTGSGVNTNFGFNTSTYDDDYEFSLGYDKNDIFMGNKYSYNPDKNEYQSSYSITDSRDDNYDYTNELTLKAENDALLIELYNVEKDKYKNEMEKQAILQAVYDKKGKKSSISLGDDKTQLKLGAMGELSKVFGQKTAVIKLSDELGGGTIECPALVMGFENYSNLSKTSPQMNTLLPAFFMLPKEVSKNFEYIINKDYIESGGVTLGVSPGGLANGNQSTQQALVANVFLWAANFNPINKSAIGYVIGYK